MELETFKREVREWLEANCPESLRQPPMVWLSTAQRRLNSHRFWTPIERCDNATAFKPTDSVQ